MYYNRIKGCGYGSTGSASDYFTYIRFCSDSSLNPSDGSTSANMTDNPRIFISKTGDNAGVNSYGSGNGVIYDNGYVLTSRMNNGAMYKSFAFYNSVWFGQSNVGVSYIQHYGNFFQLINSSSSSRIELGTNGIRFASKYNDDAFWMQLVTDSLGVYKGLEYGGGTSPLFMVQSHQIQANLPIICSNYVQATYFNATSDIRAKEEIKPAAFNALDFVKNTEVKSFTYKKSKAKSIGVIAQEVKDYDFGNGFSIVENPEASGEQGDFMSIRESKLVYVLMKAIQEQQEQIEQLKTEIKALKKTS